MMLRLDANTTLNQSYMLFITLVNITYQSRNQYLSSVHSWDSSPWLVLHISLFLLFTVCHVVLLFFKCIINLTSFLFKSNFISFPICDSALLLSHYYYCYTVIITIFIPYYKQIYIHIDIYFVFLSTCSVSTCSLIQ